MATASRVAACAVSVCVRERYSTRHYSHTRRLAPRVNKLIRSAASALAARAAVRAAAASRCVAATSSRMQLCGEGRGDSVLACNPYGAVTELECVCRCRGKGVGTTAMYTSLT